MIKTKNKGQGVYLMFHQGGDECCSTAKQCGAGEVTRFKFKI